MKIPLQETDEVRIYTCSVCNKRYKTQSGMVVMACAVMHAPGTCCHYNETEITDEQLQKINEVLSE